MKNLNSKKRLARHLGKVLAYLKKKEVPDQRQRIIKETQENESGQS